MGWRRRTLDSLRTALAAPSPQVLSQTQAAAGGDGSDAHALGLLSEVTLYAFANTKAVGITHK